MDNFATARYCECFAAGIYCDGCNCINCHNNVDNETARQEAVGITLERNPNAFKPKIASSPQKPEVSMVSNSIQLPQVFIIGVLHQSFELKLCDVNNYSGFS
jgi:hypothetical protein